MKTRILSKLGGRAFMSLFFLSSLVWGIPSEAQIAPAVYPDVPLSSSNLSTVETALIECSPSAGGGFLSAIIWGDVSGTNLFLEDVSGASLTIPISNAAPSSKPDVILGDDLNNPGVDYIAVITYQDINGDIIVENYRISGLPGTLVATPAGPSQNLGAGSAPKIDGFANNTAPIAGMPAMDQFVVVWNKPVVNDIGVYAGEVSDVTNSFYQNSYTNAGINPDVAAVRDIDINRLYACVVCFNSTSPYPGSYSYVYDIDVSAPPSTPPVVIPLLGGGNDYPRPRIEGMALYEKINPKWNVLTFIDYDIIKYFTNMSPASPLTIQVQGTPPYNPSGFIYAAAITAGPGLYMSSNPPGPSQNAPIGNRQCTLAWAGLDVNTSNYDALSAGIGFNPGGAPQNYQITNPASVFRINSSPMGSVYNYTDEYELAISTSCNSGNRLLAAWWNSSSHLLLYKLTPNNMYQFKPTGLPKTAEAVDGFEVFPIPADKTFRIKSSDGFKIKSVRILNVLGKLVLEMPYAHAPVDVSSLPSGNYFISLQGENHNIMTRPLVIKH